MNTFEIALKTKTLPTKAEDLVPLSFIGNSAVKFYTQKLKLFSDLGMTEEQKKKTLSDGQDAGVMLLEIERRIGEISDDMPSLKKGELSKEANKFNIKFNLRKNSTEIKAKRLGLKNHIALTTSQTIKNHPKEVAEVIKEAKANDDIPTKTAVINKVKMKKYQEMLKKPKKKVLPDINSLALDMFNKLSEVYGKLNEIIKYKKELSKYNKEGLIESIDRLIKLKEKLK